MIDDVLGHDDVKSKLRKDIQNNTLSHAYLFSGIEGIGKKKLALEFAKQILKTDNLDTCVDFKLIQKLEDKKDIVVEQIREKIVNDIYIAPATCEQKVYIIDDAHLLNLSAQNSILKTLEEPPKYVVIILITNDEKALLTTVMSRVKKIVFNKLQDDIIVSKLNALGKEISKYDLEYVNGSLKHAINISELNEENKYIKIRELEICFYKKDFLKAIKTIGDISFKDEETFNYLEYLLMKKQEYNKIGDIERARLRMHQNANEEIVKQALCVRMFKEM